MYSGTCSSACRMRYAFRCLPNEPYVRCGVYRLLHLREDGNELRFHTGISSPRAARSVEINTAQLPLRNCRAHVRGRAAPYRHGTCRKGTSWLAGTRQHAPRFHDNCRIPEWNDSREYKAGYRGSPACPSPEKQLYEVSGAEQGHYPENQV